MYYFSKTSIGYSHVEKGTCCQDFSSSYSDSERTIVTTCDGHGGKIYIRSNLGSKFASNAIIEVFKEISYYSLRGEVPEDYLNKLKLEVLCSWNAQVEKHLKKYPIRRSELSSLSEEEIAKLERNPEKAYGTTMIGIMQIGNKLVAIHLGDGESLLIKKGEITPIFEEDEDEPVANITYSLCGEDAFEHIHLKVINFNEYDGALVCTDGMVNPYQNYINFNDSMIKPMIKNLIETHSYRNISEHISNLGLKLGIGDDVSLGFIIRGNLRERYYK